MPAGDDVIGGVVTSLACSSISISSGYHSSTCWQCVCVCVCVTEKERVENERWKRGGENEGGLTGL